MPMLAWRKFRANAVIGSPASRADIAETITCAYMAAATLAGAGLNFLFGLWWAEYSAAAALLVFIVMEASEAVDSARGRRENQRTPRLPRLQNGDRSLSLQNYFTQE